MTSLTTDLVEITPELAQNFLSEEFHYHANRRIRPRHVKFLAEAMKAERFDPTAQIGFARLPDRQKHLINGQHTLSAIVDCGIPQQLNVIHYNIQCMDEVASLFSHYDIGFSRTFSDSVKAFGVSDATGLSSTQISRLAAAIKYITAGFPQNVAREKIPSEDMIELIYLWADVALAVFNLMHQGESRLKKRSYKASVLSVFLVIKKYDSAKADEFIGQSLADDGLKVGDPRKALNRYLSNVSAQSTRTATDTMNRARSANNGEISRAVAKAWGKYIKGLKIQKLGIQSIEVGRPIVIENTPYTGKFRTVG